MCASSRRNSCGLVTQYSCSQRPPQAVPKRLDIFSVNTETGPRVRSLGRVQSGGTGSAWLFSEPDTFAFAQMRSPLSSA